MSRTRLALTTLTAALWLLSACGPPSSTPATSGTAGASGSTAGVGGSTAGSGGAPGGASSGGTGGAPLIPVMPIGTEVGAIIVDSVAVWKGDAKGAYTIIHDDLCDYGIDSLYKVAEPELTQRGLRSAFGAIVSRCEERSLWPQLEMMRESGHEIINHSWDHKNLVTEASGALDEQIDHATRSLDEHLVNQKTTFFIFPYDAFDDAAVQRLSTLGYLGARAGERGINTADFPDGMRVRFDVYGPEYSFYKDQGDILKYYVDLAISEGGWSVREFHGVAEGSFEPAPLVEYQAHLDYVKSKVDSGELWVDTPSTVVRYRFARRHCGMPTQDEYKLTFGTPSADCVRYSTPLTVTITTAQDPPSLLALQNGKMLTPKKLGANKFAVDIDPAQGPTAIGGGS